MDLFDDLPEPTQTRAAPQSTREEDKQDRGFKRKRDDAERHTRKKQEQQEEQQEEEEQQEQQEEEQEESHKVCKEGLPVLRGYVAARRGERDDMQDAHVLLPDMSGHFPALPGRVSRVSYFAVFDGHGGARASQFAAENLHQNLVRKFPSGETENLDKLIKKCLLDTFRQTDEDFLKKASSQKPAWKDGSTATCVLVVDDTVYVANLGDSRVETGTRDRDWDWDQRPGPGTRDQGPGRDSSLCSCSSSHGCLCLLLCGQAVLCRVEAGGAAEGGEGRPLTLALSKEHNPTIYEERMRIQRAGGTVRDGRVLGVLEVSRSIGDGQYKRCGVISTPDLRRCQLSASDRFIILACDGLFKVFSADEAVRFVLGVLQEASVEAKEGLTEAELRYEAACQQLASEAVRRGCADNVTVILVSIGC